MPTFDILNPDLNIFQSYFLEASAGTGKTFAIEHLVIRLILESKEPIQLQEILAVTFTREAAFEMKTRIRAKLEEVFKKEPENRRVEEALLAFDEIQVFTIHGFCHRMLSEFAFEARGPIQSGGSELSEPHKEMREVVEDFFRTGDPQFASDVSALLKRNRYDLNRLVIAIINQMLEKKIPKEIPKIGPLPFVDEEALREDFLQLAPRYKRLKVEDYSHQVGSLSQFFQLKELSILLEEKEWFFEKMHETNAKVRAAPLENLSLRYPSLLPSLRDALVPYLEIIRDPNERLLRIAAECRKRWETKALRFDQFTFDQILQTMQKASQHASFAQKMRKKYKAVIVDEFQDTDPVQWDIFSSLFLKGHLLYLVGDPKQSIYGFRNADIYTYMRAAQALGEEKRAHLDTNFRSHPQLIERLNRFFTKVEDWIALPSLPGSLTYHPVKAGRENTEIQESPFHCFFAHGDKGRERGWPTKKMEKETLFPYIANEMIRLHRERKIPFCEMAILVKDRFQALRLEEVLRRAGLPCLIKRTRHIAESRGYYAMELFLRAVREPKRQELSNAILQMGEAKEKLSFPILQTLFEEKGFASLIETFLKSHIFSHDPELYAEFRSVTELLMQEEETLDSLLQTMEEWKKTSVDEDERLKLIAEEGEDKTMIMTTFGSKGLEFDVVFCLGIASRFPTEEESEERSAEKMRELYVALTRAKEKIYLPCLFPMLPEGNSPIELFFNRWNMGEEELLQELQELGISCLKIHDTPLQELREKEGHVTLTPPLAPHLDFPHEVLTSFSSMAKQSAPSFISEKFYAQDLTEKSLHTLPLGAETGNVIHALFETHFENLHTPLDQLVCERLSETHLVGYEELIVDMMERVLGMPLVDGFSLNELKEGEYCQEMEFLFAEENRLIKGFADLIFQRGEKFYIVDWKTNWLGPSDDDYTEKKMRQAMHEHDYFLQADLYTKALRKYVKRFYNAPFEELFGGAYYLFIRGKKAFGIC